MYEAYALLPPDAYGKILVKVFEAGNTHKGEVDTLGELGYFDKGRKAKIEEIITHSGWAIAGEWRSIYDGMAAVVEVTKQ